MLVGRLGVPSPSLEEQHIHPCSPCCLYYLCEGTFPFPRRPSFLDICLTSFSTYLGYILLYYLSLISLHKHILYILLDILLDISLIRYFHMYLPLPSKASPTANAGAWHIHIYIYIYIYTHTIRICNVVLTFYIYMINIII